MFARPGLPSFDYVQASTPEEVTSLLNKHGDAAKLLMGGTDLFPGLRDGILRPQVLIDVKQLPGMHDIRFDSIAGLTIGAAVTMNELARHPDVQTHYPLLAEAASTVASYQIRNRATVGGNLCNASPCADTSPAMLVLEAEFILYGPDGQRTVPAGEFFLGPGQTVIQTAELLLAIRIPRLPAGGWRAAARYLKLGRCKSGDLALVGVAVLGFTPDSEYETDSGYEFRIGLGSVAPTPLRASEAERLLASNPPSKGLFADNSKETFALAAEMAMDAASAITDVRGSADYQKAMVRTLTLRGLVDVWEQLHNHGA
jgi:CO/xanthine dehydrogenase FAD-binding subunit